MKIAKKTLSIFLSLLMIFSACSAGLTGIIASAAAEDSDYTAAEVAALINAATAGGFTLSSSNDRWDYASDDGKVIAAAEAIFNYALAAYREGKEATHKGNSSKALYDYFTAEFQSMYTNKTAADRLVKNVLYPDGTAIFSVENPGTKTTKLSESETEFTKGADVTSSYPIESYSSYYASGIAAGTTNKFVDIQLDINAYLMTFSKIEEIPSSFLMQVKYQYAHVASTTATVSDVTSRTEGSGCSAKTYYTPTISTTAYNYMSAKPVRQVVKNTQARKQLLSYEKYFNDDRLAMTREDMLAMSMEDISALYKTTDIMFTEMTENYNDVVLDHFGLNPSAIKAFMADLYFAYRVVAGKYNIDILNNLINSEYNEESYAEMSALYAKTSTAYNVVYSMDTEIINYIVNEGGYSAEYESAMALKSAAESYNAVLFDVMTEQKLDETVAAMVATYTDYINVLNKEDIDKPSDAEVIGLVQKVEAFDAIIDSYKGYSYYRNYWTTDYESEWARFSAILDEVYEVRGLKMEFETYYDYFLPLIYTTEIDTLDNEDAISLHADLDTKIDELRASYKKVGDKWGYTIADKIFTVVYEDSKYLLQTLVDSVKSTGKEAVKTVLIARTEAQLDAVYAYKDTTVVNFSNFASIKSTLTYFDYDLYNYVNGGGEGQNKWLSTDYTNKYSMVQTLLDRYHAFSTSDGKAFFDEDFTFADANGIYANRYAGSQYDEEGKQIGYPSDIARDEAKDNYTVTEDVLKDTIVKIDNFITSRDFGALLGFVDVETDEYCDLATYLTNMLNEMLYTDDLINTLVGAIYPMVVDLLNTELVGMLADMGENTNANASACIDLEAMEVKNAKGHLYVYMDDDLYNGKEHLQRNLDEVLADAGLYVYPQTLAKSLMMSNPAFYGVGTPIYNALMEAGRDWTKLVCSDDPETPEDETKVLEFEWGVYDAESFTDTLGCIFDSLLPLLNAVLTGTTFSETLNNAAYVYSSDVKYSIISAGNIAAYGHLNLTIPGLTVFNDVLVPLFEILGVNKMPTLKSGASGDEIAKAIVNPLLSVIDEVLSAPLTTVLDILPNLVYFISMDSVQEILNSLNISLNLKIEAEIDKDKSGTLADLLGGTLVDLLGDNLAFDVNLAIADMIDLYDMLGFEISDFNEILNYVIPMLGVEGLKLPPINQQEIIFCSDWGKSPTGRVFLNANEADLVFWLLNYVVSALVPDENGNSLLSALLGEDMDPMLSGIISKVVSNLTNNPDDAFAAIIELLNPTTYDLKEMKWAESTYNYNGIEVEDGMSIVYLNYGNDWTREHSEYLVDNAAAIIDSILGMTGSEPVDHGAELQKLLEGLFTNANITALVEMLGGFGDSPSAIIADIVTKQVGINIDSWFIAFGYLFPKETWADDAEIVPPTHRNYVNNFGVEGIANEDGTISWFFNKMPLVDGDGYTFVNILTRLLGEADVLLDFLFAGEAVSAFDGLLTLNGYETYASSLGLLLTMLGVEDLPTQADFNNDVMGSFSNMLTAVLDWFYDITNSEDVIAKVIEILPNLFYFLESNGLSTFLYNLLMPVLVIVDTVRPLVDVDVNGVLSLIVSDLLNYYTVDFNKVLQYIVHGAYANDDLEYVYYSVDIFNLTFSEILKLADLFFGTNLYTSGLNEIGIKGYCSGLEEKNTSVGKVYKSTMDAADALTVLVTAVVDCLGQPSAVEGKTNGDQIFAFVTEVTGKEEVENYYKVIIDLIKGVTVEYESPNWGYMFTDSDMFTVDLPKSSIVYLGYNNNWTKETADAVYDSLEEIVAMILDSALEGETIATLVNGLLEDNVYSNEIINTVVELIVNLIAALDETLRTTVDKVLATDIATWFSFCTYNEETGKYECTKDWGIDKARNKKTAFVDAMKQVLAPANELLTFLFFGGSYNFLTASDKTSLLNVNGGEGYAECLVPILEALGCTMKPASAYYVNGGYDVPAAVADIFNALLALVDKVSDAPAEEVFKLLPNIIYFLNADGFKTSVNNLLAPINGFIDGLAPMVDFSIAGVVKDAIGLDISDLSTEGLLAFAAEKGFVMDAKLVNLVKTFYLGKLVEFESANGDRAFRMVYTEKETAGDMLTIVLSLAIDLFKQNKDLLGGLLGEETYDAIMSILNLTGPKPMQRFDWLYTEYADMNKTFSAIETTELYTATYNEYWTKDKAQYFVDNGDDVIRNILELLQLEMNGQKVTTLDGLLDALISQLYSQENADALLAMVKDLVAQLSELEPYGNLIKTVAKSSLGVDLTAWDNMVLTVKDGDRRSFANAISKILAPVVPVLEILLTGKDVSFFVNIDGKNAINLYGSEGYAYGIIPLLEALGCKNVLTPEEYKAAVAKNQANAISAIINPLFDKIDEIAADPFNQILDLLPAVTYFVNSNGLDTVAKNILNSVDTVLAGLEPLIGKASIMDLLGIDLATYNFEYLVGLLVDMAAEEGFVLNTFAVDAINELTTGTVVSYQSKNGETYYTMQYAADHEKADMVTVILRLVIEFITYEEKDDNGNVKASNIAAIEGLLKGAISDEDTFKAVCAILESIADAARADENKGKAMAAVYYLFVTVDQSADFADDVYHDVTNSWEFILKLLETSNEPALNGLSTSLKEALNKYFDAGYELPGEEEEEEKPLTGFALFVAKIKAFFQKIGDFFKNLFGGNK